MARSKTRLYSSKNSLGDGLNVEGLVASEERMLPESQMVPVDVGELLHGGAARKVSLYDHAAEGRPRAFEARVDQMNLADRSVCKDDQQIIAQLVRDQLSRLSSLRFAHPVSVTSIERDIQDVNAVKLRDALG